MPRWITGGVAVLSAMAGLAVLAAYDRLAGWRVEPMSPEALAQELRPGFEFVAPEGDGPFPTGIFFHGCGGVSDGIRTWARELKSAGWAALILDSLRPRGITGEEVCGGRRGQCLPERSRRGSAPASVRR